MAALAQEELRASFHLCVASARCGLLAERSLPGKPSLVVLAVTQWSVVLEMSNLRLHLQFLLGEVEEEKGGGEVGVQLLTLPRVLNPHPSKENQTDGVPGMLNIHLSKFWISF